MTIPHPPGHLLRPVCPWCYVGKANLDRALQPSRPPLRHPVAPVPAEPRHAGRGRAKRAYLEAKFGGKARSMPSTNACARSPAAQAASMDPDKPQRMPNTLNAHR
jgi:predicted DsbA family dithiol-disulfide isomerase